MLRAARSLLPTFQAFTRHITLTEAAPAAAEPFKKSLIGELLYCDSWSVTLHDVTSRDMRDTVSSIPEMKWIQDLECWLSITGFSDATHEIPGACESAAGQHPGQHRRRLMALIRQLASVDDLRA
jgi:hypothetical protein